MLKAVLISLPILGLTSAMIVTIPRSQGDAEVSPGPALERLVLEPASPGRVDPGHAPEPIESAPSVAGLELVPIPRSLAAQLDLSPGIGVLVRRVAPDSPAAAAGLQAHDVLVSIDGRPAAPDDFEGLSSQPGGAVLRVIRGGLPRQVALAMPGGDGAFLSVNDLSADHPFRRFGELQALRASYSGEVERHGERLRALDQESRGLREEARRQVDALQSEAIEEVAGYFAEEEQELLELVNERLQDARLEPLTELGLDLESLLPPARRVAVTESLAGSKRELSESLKVRLSVEPLDDSQRKRAKRAEKRLHGMVGDMARLVNDRIERPFAEMVQDAERHKKRLASHSEKVTWVQDAVRQIRVEVGKRITCAGQRSRDEVSKSLRKKLEQMEVPQPGEMEAALTDVRAQIDHMTRRFLSRTESGLLRYESEVRSANEVLVAELETCLAHCEASAARLGKGLGATVATHVGEGRLDIQAGWRDEAVLADMTDALRRELHGLVNRERNTSRAGSRGITRALKDHRDKTEEAWDDLKGLLGGLRQEAGNDCWKLDGPHLDGRFPEKPGKRESGGEVAFNDR